ncbi:hypothetical protein NLG97_g706 [Lecanicillium saksenae]|uniref:Uncharacterized protein n=1 Tax=Lecanicillium saksenae TaxID=468837 RepID=A0ACC1R5U3_9HYPO|nr:hypothetical protein NLG97_g706 [Lecanicillium saksenae]
MGSRSGQKHIHEYYPRLATPAGAVAAAEAAKSVRYHSSIETLREAAAAGCELCILVLGEANALLAELAALEKDSTRLGRHSAPLFDMWLTQRPEGGQGFWVISDQKFPRRAAVIMPIAAFGFVVEEDEPFAPVIRGRPVRASIDTRALGRLQRYISTCNDAHEGCQRIAGPVPKRLLDLQTSKDKDGNIIKIVQLGDTSEEKYVALSYPAESGIVSCLEGGAPNNDAEIQVDDLPKTFQDAVLVTRSLGIRYLWIDSLCIPGALAEWQRWSEQAGAVYKHAYLTISATGATDSLGGLLLPRPEPRCARLQYQDSNGADGTVMASSLPLAKDVCRDLYGAMRDEPISQGVWSFQDRVLSRRTIHFATDQIYIECMRQFVSEDGLLERVRFHSTAETLVEGTGTNSVGGDEKNPIDRWYAILWDYANRVPANPTDKLTALSNVAREFQALLQGDGDDYIAGHWSQSIRVTWPRRLGRGPRSTDIVAAGLPNRSSYHTFATLLDKQAQLDDAANPFGRVTAASITLSAPPLIPLQLVEETELALGSSVYRQVKVRSRSRGSEEDPSAVLDVKEKRFMRPGDELEGKKLFALVLAESHHGDACRGEPHEPEGTLHGLLVSPATGSGERKMKRLGFLMANMNDLGPSALLCGREPVTLV